MNRNKLFSSLKDIYGEKAFDLDINNQVETLKNKGWIFEDNAKQINKPDFLIEYDNRIILIELKEMEEKQTDINLKENIEEMRKGKKTAFAYWGDPYRKNLKGHIEKSNIQLKEFVKSNKGKFFKNNKYISDLSTIVAFISKRLIHHYTLPGIMDELFGDIVEEIDEFSHVSFFIKNSLLNRERYRSIGLIAIWDGKEKFNIYNNPFALIENNIPIFLTKNDRNIFIIDDYFSKLKGIRIFVLNRIYFDNRKEIIYLINGRPVDEEHFLNDLLLEINNTNKNISDVQNAIRNRLISS